MYRSMSLLRRLLGPDMTRRTAVVLAATFAMTGVVRGDYASFVLSLEPSLYYRLNETEVGTVFDSSTPANAAVHAGNVLDTDLNQTPGALAPIDNDSYLRAEWLGR